MRRELVVALVAMAVGSACSYHEPVSGDAMVIPPVTVGFASGTTLVDENSGQVAVPVVLSATSDHAVRVDYAIAGGTATLGADYSATASGTIDFSPGQTMGAIELTIINDGIEEPDETIDLMLSNADGGVLGTDMHVITIAANVLPRVSFTTDNTSAMENVAMMIEVQLDKPSPIPVSVDYMLAGSATPGTDYTLTAGTITFPANTTTQQLALGVIDDALNEDNETVTIALANPTNALLGAFPSITDTILDDDPEPDVKLTKSSDTSPESTPTVTLTVTLTAPSGRMVTVPFSASMASTALSPDDYTYTTASPLVFPAGMTSQTITIAVVNDTIDEPDETVITVLGMPTNANLATPSTHTLTITDDDLACYGTGNSKVCFDSAPTMPVTLPASIDTSVGGALCSATQAVGWTAGGQPQACFIVGTTITQSGPTLVHGTRPLVLVASDQITISALLDVASHIGGTTGPASPGTCKAFAANPGNAGSGGGGGAGGSFMSGGGDGGKGDNGGVAAGIAATADAAAPTVLRAGCDGQRGGNGGPGNNPGAAGRGGGVVYLVAGNMISIPAGGIINASGSAGSGGGHFTGGTGAGSGGMIKLFATAITATGGVLFANGGGGASGGDGGNGSSGSDPTSATTPAAGGSGGGGNGGAGFANGTPAVSGAQGGNNNAGGGGGGGGGYIQANVALPGATVSAGLIQAP